MGKRCRMRIGMDQRMFEELVTEGRGEGVRKDKKTSLYSLLNVKQVCVEEKKPPPPPP